MRHLVETSPVWALVSPATTCWEARPGRWQERFAWPDQPNRRIRDPYIRWCGLSITHISASADSLPALLEDGDVGLDDLLNERAHPAVTCDLTLYL